MFNEIFTRKITIKLTGIEETILIWLLLFPNGRDIIKLDVDISTQVAFMYPFE